MILKYLLTRPALSRKAIFVYPLVADFRRRLGLSPRVELLVRAKHNRALVGENDRLFETLRQAPAVTQLSIALPRQSACAK